MTAPFRRIVANLDWEGDLAARAASKPRAALSRAALSSASTLGTLLRAFAAGGKDRLWTPAPVARERLAEVPGLPHPVLESGALESLPAARAVLAWGAVATQGSEPSALRPPAASLPVPEDAPGTAPLAELLWTLPPADLSVAAVVHHRAFALATARNLGCALPGAAIVSSLAELEVHLRSLDEGAFGKDGAWIVKATYSAAGRTRYLGHGHAETRDRDRVKRLFDRHGSLLFEPWYERLDDYGLAAILDGHRARVVGFHRSFVGPRGAVRGLELDARFAGLSGLEPGDRRLLEETAGAVGRALAAGGYAGPFGIDCWRYRRPSGEIVWNPLGEINARMTLGLVARTLVDRVRQPLGIDPRAAVRLGWGQDPPPAAIVLTHGASGPDKAPAVWLAVVEPGDRAGAR